MAVPINQGAKSGVGERERQLPRSSPDPSPTQGGDVAMRLVDRVRTTVAPLALASLWLATVACSGSGEAAAPRADTETPSGDLATPTLRPGDALPAPSGDVVLTLTGKLAGERSAPVELDIATIEQMGLRSFTLYEPFVKKDMTFRGVDFADVVSVVGMASDARKLHTVALDDYSIDIDLEAIDAGGVMLATANGDGSPIAVADGGPIRIVFLDTAKAGADTNLWIWSLVTAEVR